MTVNYLVIVRTYKRMKTDIKTTLYEMLTYVNIFTENDFDI
jgi:hypothetical protein